MKHIIWTNNLDYEDWKDDLEEEYPPEEYSDEYRMQTMYEINDSYLDDERMNLDKEFDREIIAVGNLSFWNRKVNGYKLIGTNLNNIFNSTCGDYVTWYVENEDIKCDDSHHDGTNHYIYRILKPGIDINDFDECFHYSSVLTAVAECTEPLGCYVAEIYGFKQENK